MSTFTRSAIGFLPSILDFAHISSANSAYSSLPVASRDGLKMTSLRKINQTVGLSPELAKESILDHQC
ncbi:MAG: hypothetical protein ACRCT1_11615 [Microcoleaceae cyanobacterium]